MMKRALLFFALIAMGGVSAFAADPPTLGDLSLCGKTLKANIEADPLPPLADFDRWKFYLVDSSNRTPLDAKAVEDFGKTTNPEDLIVSGVILTLPNPIAAEDSFLEFRQDSLLVDMQRIPIKSDSVVFSASRRSQITVTFPCEVEQVKVEVKRDGETLPTTSQFLRESNKRVLNIALTQALVNEDTVTITGQTAAGDTVTVEKEIEAEAPADIDSAVVYVGGKLEVAEDSKPKILIDLKYDKKLRRIGNSPSWTHGPSLLVDAATQDSDGEGKATLGYGVRWLGYIETPKRFILERFDATAALEADDGLNTRNLIADISYQLQFPGEKWNFKPAIGLEGGTNLAIKTKLEEFSDYNMLRPTVDLVLSREFKDFKFAGLKSVTFSIDTQSRYLLEDEPDVEPLPKSEQTDDETTKTIAADGFKFYGKASLTFGLTENYSIALEYEVGEQPPLYGENNKGSLSVVYSF
jgi:hypothetical protein